jgi:hypothetical protein
MTDRASAVVAGLIVLILTGTPTALVSYAIRTGAVGSAPNLGLTIVAYLIILAAVAAVAHRLDRALGAARAEGRSPADAWVPFFVASCVTIVGGFIVPVAILALMVNSDRSLNDNPLFFYVAWGGAFLLVALVAYGIEWAAEWTLRRQRPAVEGSVRGR